MRRRHMRLFYARRLRRGLAFAISLGARRRHCLSSALILSLAAMHFGGGSVGAIILLRRR